MIVHNSFTASSFADALKQLSAINDKTFIHAEIFISVNNEISINVTAFDEIAEKKVKATKKEKTSI